jgi:hypothetical protein
MGSAGGTEVAAACGPPRPGGRPRPGGGGPCLGCDAALPRPSSVAQSITRHPGGMGGGAPAPGPMAGNGCCCEPRPSAARASGRSSRGGRCACGTRPSLASTSSCCCMLATTHVLLKFRSSGSCAEALRGPGGGVWVRAAWGGVGLVGAPSPRETGPLFAISQSEWRAAPK